MFYNSNVQYNSKILIMQNRFLNFYKPCHLKVAFKLTKYPMVMCFFALKICERIRAIQLFIFEKYHCRILGPQYLIRVCFGNIPMTN